MGEFALKDYVDRSAVRRLGERIQSAYGKFDLERFVKAGAKGLNALEFTARTKHIANVLREFLPSDVPKAFSIVGKSLPGALTVSDGMFKDNFWLWPLSDFVHQFGGDHWQATMDVSYKLTQCFTAEFAIRPQLQREPKKTLDQLLAWTGDKSDHVRRLCSEGPRPRLPWAARLDLPRDRVFPILEALNDDPSRFVQKSVANHLNDMGKDDPKWLIKTMNAWSKKATKNTDWIVRHALRTQIKSGDPDALAIIGYGPAKLKSVALRVTPKKIKHGQNVNATIELTGAPRNDQLLLIDWVMHFCRPNGQRFQKVFKGKEVSLGKGDSLEWTKAFPMKNLSTRKVYPGTHTIDVQINGKVLASADFELTK